MAAPVLDLAQSASLRTKTGADVFSTSSVLTGEAVVSASQNYGVSVRQTLADGRQWMPVAVSTPVTYSPGQYWFEVVSGVTVFSYVDHLGNIVRGGNSNPMTTLGDTVYGGPGGTPTRLPGNTAAVKKFLTEVGDGVNSAAPTWSTITAGDLGGALPNLWTSGYLDLTPQVAPSLVSGRVWADTDQNSIAHYNGVVTVHLGQESVVLVRNATGSAIPGGKAVYLHGNIGSQPLIVLASNATYSTSQTIGLVSANIADNAQGYVVTSGLCHSIDTSAYVDGDVLWLGTAGAITSTRPSDPTRQVRIGYVVRAHATQGKILVAVQVMDTLDGLSDVQLTSPSPGQILSFDGAKWVNTAAPSSGFTNPMTSIGDLIYGGAAGVATRLAAGTSGYILQAQGAAAPAWFDLFGSANTWANLQTIQQVNDIGTPALTLRRLANDTALSLGYSTGSSTWQIASSFTSTGAYRGISFWTSDLQRVVLDTSGNVNIVSGQLQFNGTDLFARANTWTTGQTIDLGTGATSATYPLAAHGGLRIYGNGANPTTPAIYGAAWQGAGLSLIGQPAGGTRAVPAVTPDGRVFVNLLAYGYNGAYTTVYSGRYQMVADGVWSGANQGVYHVWDGTTGGSNAVAEWMRLQNGNLTLTYGVLTTTYNGNALRLIGGVSGGLSLEIDGQTGLAAAGRWRIGDGVSTSNGTFVIYDYKNSAGRLYIDANGAVGIARTPYNSTTVLSAGTYPAAASSSIFSAYFGGRIAFLPRATAGAYNPAVPADSAVIIGHGAGIDADVLVVGTHSSSASAMVLNNVGVGIGGAPGVRFQVVHDQAALSYFDYYNNTAAGGIYWRMVFRNLANTGNTTGGLYKPTSGGMLWLNDDTHANNFSAISVGGAERMRIDSNGNVGIGVAPTSKLHVNAGNIQVDGDVNGDRYVIVTNASTGVSARGYVRAAADSALLTINAYGSGNTTTAAGLTLGNWTWLQAAGVNTAGLLIGLSSGPGAGKPIVFCSQAVEVGRFTSGTLSTGKFDISYTTASTDNLTGALTVVGGIASQGTIFGTAIGSWRSTSGVAVAIDRTDTSQFSDIAWRSGGSARWSLRFQNQETGSNAGGTLSLIARDDTGNVIDTVLAFTRVAGTAITVNRPLDAEYGLTVTSGGSSNSTLGGKLRLGHVGTSASAWSNGVTGLELVSGDINTTNKYTSFIKFGSTDASLTTTSPKFAAGIAGYATEAWTADTSTGMGLAFFTSPAAGGTDSVAAQVATLSGDGDFTIKGGLVAGNLGTGEVGGYSTITRKSAVTAAAVTDCLDLIIRTTGAAANGFGGDFRIKLEDSSGPEQQAYLNRVIWVDATNATRKARVQQYVYDTSAREAVRLEAFGGTVGVGLLGASAVSGRVSVSGDAYVTGSLGVGVVPSYRLHVGSTSNDALCTSAVTSAGDNGAAGAAVLLQNVGTATQTGVLVQNGTNVSYFSAGAAGSLQLGTSTAHSLQFGAGGAIKFTINTDGRLLSEKTSDPTTIPTFAQSYIHLGRINNATNNGYRAITSGYVSGATYAPVAFGYQQTTLSGFTYGDFFVATRSVTTDTVPTVRLRVGADGRTVVEKLTVGTVLSGTTFEVDGQSTFWSDVACNSHFNGTGFIRTTGGFGGTGPALGYATGAGGSVTQTTNINTGVTLNAHCGTITTVSVQLTTTPQSFTLTNNKITTTTQFLALCQTPGVVVTAAAPASGSISIGVSATVATSTTSHVISFILFNRPTS